ncbi:MAG: F420-dependent oxidoreductase [Devosia sp.]|uniref:pyrroline-5-carboxylate reductase n=1 Tax=Devosia sp. TaxID=1871048 RepID=UPI002626027D|nr:pyrroline-5-carboxylate reductase [Devosia sp.]MDB5529625.1 F420-dependent oxidoreductase [Devosia sp.]
MTLGFVGTGTITAAIVRGLRRDGDDRPIVLSPRNAVLATELAAGLPDVQVAASNQDVLDRCDTVFIAVTPQVVAEVMGDLRFEPRHRVISLVATVSMRRLSELVEPAGRLRRAVPLPFVAVGLGGTLLYPTDPEIAALFDRLGRAITLASEDDIDVLTVASATMSAYFATMANIDSWLVEKGIPAEQSRAYLAQLGIGLAAAAADHPNVSYAQLVHNYATPGGLNEQLRQHLDKTGAQQSYSEGLDALFTRVKGR